MANMVFGKHGEEAKMDDKEVARTLAITEGIARGQKDGAILIFENSDKQIGGMVFTHNMGKAQIIKTVLKTFDIKSEELPVILKFLDYDEN